MNKKNRLVEIDAARGIAMLAVCLSHFSTVYLYPHPGFASTSVTLIELLVSFASPLLIIISGMMLGLLYESGGANWENTKRKLIDRGLFLLTIGHVLMATGHVARSDSLLGLLRWGFITDSIGISVIIGCIFINRIKERSMLLISAILFSASWSVILLWEPTGNLCVLLKETLFGSLRVKFYEYNYPLFPWFSLYLYGAYLGRKIEKYYVKQDWLGIERCLAMNCGFLICLFLSLKLGQILLIAKSSDAFLFGGALVKYPPSGGFFLLYGGIGLAITLFVFKLTKTRWGKTLLEQFAVIGKTSFFVFAIQYHVYNTTIYQLNLPYTIFWPALFVGTIFLIYHCARKWLNRDLNKLITVAWIFTFLGKKVSA